VGTEPLVVPASLAQQSLWVHSRVAENGAAYHVTVLIRVTGRLQLSALERAVDVIVDRHESLRTVFRIEGDELMQVVNPEQPTVLEVQSVSREELDGAVEKLLDRPFDLASGPLLRLHVLRQSAEEHVLVLVMHHIITDAVSSSILRNELMHLYEAERTGTEPRLADLPIQYADYAVWQRQRLSGDRLQRLTDYWSARLAGAKPLGDTNRSVSEPAPAIQSTFRWPEQLVGQVHQLASERGVTPFMTLVAAFAAVLARFHNQADVTVLSPVDGRGRPQLGGIVGYFINAVLIRVDLSGDPTVATLLKRVKTSTLEAFDHQELPIEQVSGLLRRHGEPGADRVCSGAMVVLQESRPSTWQVADLTFELLRPPAPIAKADVVLDVCPDGGAFVGTLECDRAVLTPADGSWLLDRLSAFLARACEAPQAKVAELIDGTRPARHMYAKRANGGPPHADTVAINPVHAEFVEPRNPIESAVAQLWRAVLGEGPPVGAYDNFFDLGGQSLAAVRIATRLREMFGIEVSVAVDLYSDFTVAAVAMRVAERIAERAKPAPPAHPLVALPRDCVNGAGELHFRATPLQQGMWAGLTPDRLYPLILGGVRVRGELDVERLKRAFSAVAARHETLRSTYREFDGELMQVVSPEERLPVAVRDAVPDEYADIVRMEVDRGFDLEREVPARVVVLRFAEDDHAVLLIMHHLIGDRRSLDVLARDAWAYYVEKADTLPRLRMHVADFAQWHNTLLEGPRSDELVAYWVERLRGARPPTVPGDLTPTGASWSPGASVEVPIPAKTFDGIAELAADSRVTLNSIGLTAFSSLLARWTGDREICIRVPVTIRDDSQLQDVVADFCNDVVVRLDLSRPLTFADLLHQVERVTADAFAHHELPPHLLEPHLPEPGLLSGLFQIEFTTEPDITVEPMIEELTVSSYIPQFPYAYRPLSVRLRHGAAGPKCVWSYQRDRFSRVRIERLAADYVDILAEMATDIARDVVLVTTAVGASPDHGS
jgi:non-ribosomal peptide synthetase component F